MADGAARRGNRLLSLDECRKLLGDRCAGWTDAELERHVEQLEDLARWCFDELDRRRCSKPPAERLDCPPLALVRRTA